MEGPWRRRGGGGGVAEGLISFSPCPWQNRPNVKPHLLAMYGMGTELVGKGALHAVPMCNWIIKDPIKGFHEVPPQKIQPP